MPFPGLKLIQLRGRGGFAEVWEAESPHGERIAVKFMLSRNSSSSSKEMRIIQTVQKLTHRHLLRISDVLSIPDYIVVAMELADGSLLDLLDVYATEYNSPLPGILASGYLKQAALALDFLNSRRHAFDGRQVGFMHCDVKPSNLLVIGETVKLADFGLCIPMADKQGTCARAGTLDFAAPEVHRGQLSETSDQYSLAVTYYHLRTGEFPFPHPPAGFNRAYSYSRPSPDLSRIHYGERRVLERALDLEPHNRFPSCVAFAKAMNEVVSGPAFTAADTSTEMRVPDSVARAGARPS